MPNPCFSLSLARPLRGLWPIALAGILLALPTAVDAQLNLRDLRRAAEDTARQAVTDTARDAGLPADAILGLFGEEDPVGKPAPDIELKDAEGSSFSLSSLLETVVLLELVDMRSPESQAFAGANLLGVEGLNPNPNVLSVNEYVDSMLGEEAREEAQFLHLVVVVADEQGGTPDEGAISSWSNLFGLSEDRGKRVVVPTGLASQLPLQQFAPRFDVISRDGHVAASASGDEAASGLHSQLIPILGNLLGIEAEEEAERETDGRLILTDTDIEELDPLYEIETPYDAPATRGLETPYDVPGGPRPRPDVQLETEYNSLEVSPQLLPELTDQTLTLSNIGRDGIAAVLFHRRGEADSSRATVATAQAARHYVGNRQIRFFHVDVASNPERAGELGVETYPSLVYFAAGEAVARLEGIENFDPDFIRGLTDQLHEESQ